MHRPTTRSRSFPRRLAVAQLAVLATMAAAVAPPVVAQTTQGDADPLAAMRFLVGHCWKATFPDGKATDRHCYAAMYGNAFIRDRHVVEGQAKPYAGETIFHFDPASQRIVYRYWNLVGGVSDGTVLPQDGALLVPGETHVTKDGQRIEIRSRFVPGGPDGYNVFTERKDGEDWREMWRMDFRKDGAAPAG